MTALVPSLLIGVVLAALIGGAAWALFTGTALRRAARATVQERDRLRVLVAHAPMRAMVVRADRRVETTAAALRLLGLAQMPR